MTATALQKELIAKISKTENISVLKGIKSLLNEEENPRKLTDIQKKMIAIGIQEMKEGKGISHEIVMKELEEKYGFA